MNLPCLVISVNLNYRKLGDGAALEIASWDRYIDAHKESRTYFYL
jgi:glucuronate isomerase